MLEQKKFYYQYGMCKAIHCNSLNPVQYISKEENEDFIKDCMVCNAISLGLCTDPKRCELLNDAPDRFDYNSFQLYKKKLGE